MFFRSLSLVAGFGKKQYTFESQKEMNELMRKIATDVSYLIRTINPSRVIFAVDDTSWRKKIYIEENDGYKANRKLSKVMNMYNVFKILDNFTEILSNMGMIVTKIKSAEADDIMTLWRDELLYNQKEHVILVSGDEDIRQLVTNAKDDKEKLLFATVFNPFMQGKVRKRKLYVPQNIFNDWINTEEEVSIWNMNTAIDVDKSDFKRLCNTENVQTKEINGNDIFMKKIFCGDDGDNVPAIYSWLEITKSSGNERQVRITPGKFKKIYEGIKNEPNEILSYEDLLKRKDKIFQLIHKISKNEPNFEIEKRLKRQIKLVVLNQKLFPETIIKNFNDKKDDELKKPNISGSNLNINTLLEGTEYVKSGKMNTSSKNEISIFKEIDNISNKKLF